MKSNGNKKASLDKNPVAPAISSASPANQQSQAGEAPYCVHCKKEIHSGERRYFSRQAGMKGLYHWECFISACRQANKVGAQELETIAVSAGVYDNFNSFDSSDD